MTDGFIQIAPDSTGKRIDNSVVNRDGGDYYRQRVEVTPVDQLAFSTSTLLTNGQTYDSGVLSLVGYTQVQTDVLSNVAGLVTIDFIRDAAGTDILRTLTIPYAAGSGYQMFSAPAFTPHVRYRFTCNEAGQTDFYFDTKRLTNAISPQVLGLDAFVSPKMVATLARSILVGRTSGGESYQNVAIDSAANLQVAVLNPRTAFGELSVAENLPTVQVDFVYGINDITTKTSTSGTGTAAGSGGMLVLDTGASASSTAIAYTARNLKYRPGQGALARFTALFTTGVAGSNQYAGVGFPDLQNGLFFGYQGATFGIHFIKSNSNTFIQQTSWNADTMDGTGGASNPSGQLLDPTKGGVYSIRYQYLGFGLLQMAVEDSTTGNFVVVHNIQYANANTAPSFLNPSMPLTWASQNTTNDTSIVVKSGSGMAAVEGLREFLGPRHGQSASATTVTSQIAGFTLKNCTTFNGVPNGSLVRIRSISFGANTGGAGSGVATIKIIKDATLGGTPAYTPYDGSTSDNGTTITSGNSVVAIDTAGTTVSNGNNEYIAIVAVGNSLSNDITDLGIYAAPGERLTFSIESTQSATIGLGMTWSEDL